MIFVDIFGGYRCDTTEFRVNSVPKHTFIS
jgi:hypothetical protein